ncbi:MAG TPA: proline dehydrogenase family protein [Actinomycetota bacterium]|nr:proline dehydrogenase family protein [Actinomycetota bacterium]
MLRDLVLGIANSKAIRSAVTGGLGRKVALRFVAGETLDDAITAVAALNADGFDVSLDHLGENISDVAQADSATQMYLAAIDRIEGGNLRANVSVKLTQLGLDLDEGLATAGAHAIVARAASVGTSVTLDMEDHRYTDRTIDACIALSRRFPHAIGVAVQTYLHRTPEDLERLIEARVHVRLCKGAYKEPRTIAFRSRVEVDAAYARLATRLIESPAYAMIATHDEALIDHAIAEIERTKRDPATHEFQMLYGVRRELQRSLLARGYRLRVYVPFGSQWYPYLMRRIAERPANMRFFAEALARG